MSRNAQYDRIIRKLEDRFTSSQTAHKILKHMHTTYEAKDNDYSATGLPMGNLRKCEDAGIEAWRGCIVRMGDKISRLENFVNQNAYMVSEKAEDTIIDLANYAILCNCLLNEELDKSLSKYYINLTKNTMKDLVDLSYYCVFQAMLWKDNDPEKDSSNLNKVISYWDILSKYSLEMI